MLKFNIRRRPQSDHSFPTEKTYEASLFVGLLDENNPQWLQLQFATGTDDKTSIFEAAIMPRHFASVVEMMMEVDPEATIRAIGKALQAVQIQRPRNESSVKNALHPG